MSHYRGKKSQNWVKGATAISVAALTAAGVIVPGTGALAATSKISGTLKIITWVNPPSGCRSDQDQQGVRAEIPGRDRPVRNGG